MTSQEWQTRSPRSSAKAELFMVIPRANAGLTG
jgi:hypothetical protein